MVGTSLDIVLQVGFLFGLHLQDAVHLVFVGQLHGTIVEFDHVHLHTHGLALGPVESNLHSRPTPQFTSGLLFIIWDCIGMILAQASFLGMENSLFQCSQPEQSRAGSRMSTLLLAVINFTWVLGRNSSSSFRTSSIVLCTSWCPAFSLSKHLLLMASSSLMKMMDGAFSLARAKAPQTSLEPSLMNICTNLGPASFRKVALVRASQIWASRVYPVPRGLYISTPFGSWIPKFSNLSLWFIGRIMACTSS